ncbi:MAG: hypothetical protein Q9202_007598 [Teloschistes flavicans]
MPSPNHEDQIRFYKTHLPLSKDRLAAHTTKAKAKANAEADAVAHTRINTWLELQAPVEEEFIKAEPASSSGLFVRQGPGSGLDGQRERPREFQSADRRADLNTGAQDLHQRLGDQEAIRQEETRSIEAPLDARLAALDAEYTQMGHTLDQLYNSMDQVDPEEDGRWWD